MTARDPSLAMTISLATPERLQIYPLTNAIGYVYDDSIAKFLTVKRFKN